MKYIKSFGSFIIEKNQGEVKTWGGLKAMINSLISKKRLDSVKSGAVNILADQLVGLIPGASNIKSAFDFFKNIYNAADNKKTNSWLDKINVDDKYSQIVDDAIENQFINHLADLIKSKNNDELLPPDFDINKELSKYLSDKFSKRTLAISK